MVSVQEIQEDFYSVLSVPPGVDLQGLQNAYSRLSDDLAARIHVDPTARHALLQLNQAYAVLSKPELRREYDRRYFADEHKVQEKAAIHDERRRRWAANLLFAALGLVVLTQVAVFGYVGRDLLSSAASAVVDPLTPGRAK